MTTMLLIIMRKAWRYQEAVSWKRTDNKMAKRKRTNNNLQHTTQNIKDWTTRAPLKTGVNWGTKGVKYYNTLHKTLKTEQHEPY